MGLAPAAFLAYALNGFFVYLGVLRALGVAPRSALTGVYYGFLGVLLVIAVVHVRHELAARVRRAPRLVRQWAVVSALFALFFCIAAVALSHGYLAHRLLGQFVLWVIPAMVALFALPRRQFSALAGALAALGFALFVIEAVVIVLHGANGRFSPIRSLDPITAADITALGAVGAMALRAGGRGEIARLVALAGCAAGTVVTGTRGSTLALLVAAVVVVAVDARTARRLRLGRTAAVLVAGLSAGFVAGVSIHSARNLTTGIGATTPIHSTPRSDQTSTTPPSSVRIRIELIQEAASAFRRRPIRGNGVGTLPDNTPEARAMGTAGCCTFPHNEIVESAYSLGVFGLLLYVVQLALVAIAAWRLRTTAEPPDTAVLFSLSFAAYAFVNSNISGELGSDVWLWSAAAAVMGLLSVSRSSG